MPVRIINNLMQQYLNNNTNNRLFSVAKRGVSDISTKSAEKSSSTDTSKKADITPKTTNTGKTTNTSFFSVSSSVLKSYTSTSQNLSNSNVKSNPTDTYLKNTEQVSNTLNNMLLNGGINVYNYINSDKTNVVSKNVLKKVQNSNTGTNLGNILSEESGNISDSGSYSIWLKNIQKTDLKSSLNSSSIGNKSSNSPYSQWIKNALNTYGISKGSFFDSIF